MPDDHVSPALLDSEHVGRGWYSPEPRIEQRHAPIYLPRSARDVAQRFTLLNPVEQHAVNVLINTLLKLRKKPAPRLRLVRNDYEPKDQ